MVRLSKLEHSLELPWQRLCGQRFAIATNTSTENQQKSKWCFFVLRQG